MHINKHNLRVAQAASKETVRYALTGVLFDPKNNRTVASDGKMLVEISTPDDESARIAENHPLQSKVGRSSKPFIVSAGKCKELEKQLCKNPRIDLFGWLSVESQKEEIDKKTGKPVEGSERVTFASGDGDDVVRREVRTIDGTFPDVDAVKPKPELAKGVLYVNPKLLKQALDAVAIQEKRQDVIKLTTFDDKMTLEARNGTTGQKAYGILMCLTPESWGNEPTKKSAVLKPVDIAPKVAVPAAAPKAPEKAPLVPVGAGK